ncbi:hypothetical protein [Psychromonas aquimarina]|uniref:hypothetical protein n=1 Tax=Psychromonas aquimarina TaxID=444919 RepID=UPI0003F7DD2C|nr:hypothetical protein [Psychromonas aquimarina]
MLQRFLYILQIFLLLFTVPFSSAEYSLYESFKVVVSRDVRDDYFRFIAGRDPLSVTDFSGAFSRRDVVELVLLQQALHLGGNKYPYQLISVDSDHTTIDYLNKGAVLLTGTSVWQSMFTMQNEIYFSIPIIKNGQFEAGLYTRPDNAEMLKVKNKQQLRAFSAVSNRIWTADWLTLQSLKISNVKHTDKWASMVDMVHSGHIDFLLAPFQSTEDLSLTYNGIKLIPVPNLKVALHGTRHFAIFKKSKHSKRILQQLNSGLTQLQARGIIDKAYRESGFFNDQVKNWKRLN